MNSKKNLILILSGIFGLLFTSTAFAVAPEFGKAAYYHDKFEGRSTASGEKYSKTAYTCAHKTLKFGTWVRVTRLDNDLSVDVRVNDRGPYSEGHVVDVSRIAAEKIELIKSGLAKVKVEVVEETVTPTPAPAPATYETKKVEEKEVKGTKTETDLKKKALKPIESSTSSTKAQPMMPDLVGYKKEAAPKSGATKTVAKEVTTENNTAAKLSLLDNATYKVDAAKVPQKGFAVQLHKFSSMEMAFTEMTKMQTTFKGQMLMQTAADGSCKVLVGPFKDKKEAEKMQKTATAKGHKKCFIVNLEQD